VALYGILPQEPQVSRKEIAREIVLWVFALFLTWVFIRQGLAKFDDTSGWARAFRTWHFPVSFRILIGMIEISAAVLLLWRRTAFIGAVLVLVVMLGAMGNARLLGPARSLLRVPGKTP
jgi:uncharacterized membrane protein YphA (DoxX/SURF4 family)